MRSTPSHYLNQCWNIVGSLGTIFRDFSNEIGVFSFKKMLLKISSGKMRPICLDLNVLNSCRAWWFSGNIKLNLRCYIFSNWGRWNPSFLRVQFCNKITLGRVTPLGRSRSVNKSDRFSWNSESKCQITLKVNVNDSHFQYQPRVSLDACSVQMCWFKPKSATSYSADKPNFLEFRVTMAKWPNTCWSRNKVIKGLIIHHF